MALFGMQIIWMVLYDENIGLNQFQPTALFYI